MRACAFALLGTLVPGVALPQNPAKWRLSAEPITRIEEGSRGADFGGVGDVRFRGDGSILVTVSKPTELRLFTSEGKFIRAIGRDGEGPGEYRAPRVVLDAGDTIAVFDDVLRRLTYFSTSGRVVSTTSLATGFDFGVGVSLRGRTGCGSWLAQAIRPLNPANSPDKFRDTINVVLLDAGLGRVERRIGSFPNRIYQRIMAGSLKGVGAQMFGSMVLLEAADRDILLIDTGTPEVRRAGCGGEPRSSINLPIPDRPVSREVLIRLKERMLSNPANSALRPAIEWRYDPANAADRLPTLRSLLPGRGGELWFEQFDADPRDPATWWVANAAGRVIGILPAPAGYRIRSIGPDLVAGVYRDEDDVESVRVYRIIR
jgi:hypothetical protein